MAKNPVKHYIFRKSHKTNVLHFNQNVLHLEIRQSGNSLPDCFRMQYLCCFFAAIRQWHFRIDFRIAASGYVSKSLPDFRIAASGCPCREVSAMPIAGLMEKAGLDNRLCF